MELQQGVGPRDLSRPPAVITRPAVQVAHELRRNHKALMEGLAEGTINTITEGRLNVRLSHVRWAYLPNRDLFPHAELRPLDVREEGRRRLDTWPQDERNVSLGLVPEVCADFLYNKARNTRAYFYACLCACLP